jgi:hypothetical protein
LRCPLHSFTVGRRHQFLAVSYCGHELAGASKRLLIGDMLYKTFTVLRNFHPHEPIKSEPIRRSRAVLTVSCTLCTELPTLLMFFGSMDYFDFLPYTGGRQKEPKVGFLLTFRRKVQLYS